MSELIVTRDGAIATVTLNRPAAMNALSKSLRRALAEAIQVTALTKPTDAAVTATRPGRVPMNWSARFCIE